MLNQNLKFYIKYLIALAILILLLVLMLSASKPQETKETQGEINTKISRTLLDMDNENNKPETQTTQPLTAKKQDKVGIEEDTGSVTVLAGEQTVQLPITPSTTFYDTLVNAQNAGTLTFLGKNYPGLGFFVTDIGSLHMSNGKNLLYYVNGKQATVGVSAYTLKDGDVIEWKLE